MSQNLDKLDKIITYGIIPVFFLALTILHMCDMIPTWSFHILNAFWLLIVLTLYLPLHVRIKELEMQLDSLKEQKE